MNVPHQRKIFLKHSFNEAWNFVKNEGIIKLKTEREETPFSAEAKITLRNKYKGEKTIVFLQEKKGEEKEYARSYSCCWDYDLNCNRTWIGMYCKALDNVIS